MRELRSAAAVQQRIPQSKSVMHEPAPVDKQVWNGCRSPDALTGFESRAAGFPVGNQFHRHRFDDFLHLITA